ncbi:hypothetical protein JYT48_00835 [Mariprofundus ferrooxydans]|nr:hypothetical protein [Mariprofundus ferrooxydans]
MSLFPKVLSEIRGVEWNSDKTFGRGWMPFAVEKLVHQPAYFVGISVTVVLRNKA